MLSIAIYSSQQKHIENIKSSIQDFLIIVKMMAKVSYFENSEGLLTAPNSFDIYIMDMDSNESVLQLGLQMRDIDPGSYFIYTSADPYNAYLASKAKMSYFLLKPIDIKELTETLVEIKKRIQFDNIIIKIAGGERRVRVNHLNYINIVKRCLCYHLTDGNMFDGQTLRSSFEKAIDPLHKHKAFLFLPPSLLINIGEIKILNNDNIVFENDDVLYFPKKQYDTVKQAWSDYNRILD